MKKSASVLTLSLALIFSAIAGTHVVNLAAANPVPYPTSPNQELPTLKVESPNEGEAFTSGTIRLNFTVTKPYSWNLYNWAGFPAIGDFGIDVYSDGNTNYYSSYERGSQDVFIYNYSVVLHGLTEGGHNLEINVRARTFYKNSNPGLDYLEYVRNVSETVHFTINDGNPPIISYLLLENKTYNQDDLSLNFTVDEPTSWIGYCLDGQDNVTTNENFTLTELPSGSHTLTIYANDTAGNMGTSTTIAFSIAEPFPTTLIATVSGASIAVIVLGLLVYFKKRKG